MNVRFVADVDTLNAMRSARDLLLQMGELIRLLDKENVHCNLWAMVAGAGEYIPNEWYWALVKEIEQIEKDIAEVVCGQDQ